MFLISRENQAAHAEISISYRCISKASVMRMKKKLEKKEIKSNFFFDTIEPPPAAKSSTIAANYFRSIKIIRVDKPRRGGRQRAVY